MAVQENIISQCGCEIRDASGNLAINVMRAAAYETNLIQKSGYRMLNSLNFYLCNRVSKKPANPNEAENPREYIEHSFFLPNSNVRPQRLLNAGGDETIQAQLEKCSTIEEATDVLQKSQGSPGSDLRDSELIGGYEVHRGAYNVLPVKTPCVSILDLARSNDIPGYLRAVRGALPNAIMEMKERDFMRKVVAGAHYVTSEPGANQQQFEKGEFPHLPQGGPQISTFLKIAMLLKANGYPGRVEIPIHWQSLRSMMIAYHASHGSVVEVAKWANDGGLPSSSDEDSMTFDFQNLRFKIMDLPHRGYFNHVGADSFDFVPIDARTFEVPEEGAGIVARLNDEFFDSYINCGGQRRENIEVSPILAVEAFAQRPFSQVEPGVEDVDADIWGGTGVHVVSGAFIPGNTRFQKFYFQGQHAYKLYPEKAYMAGAVAFRVPDFIQQLNTLGLTERVLNLPSNISVNPGINPPANSYADGQAGLDPFQPAPLPVEADNGCARPNDVGAFLAQCTADTIAGAAFVTIVVQRVGGYIGAATLDYATADDTAIAGTDYTAASGTLSWAAGEGGFKSFQVPIANDANDDVQFDVNFSSPVGADFQVGSCESTKVNINAANGVGY